MRIAVLLAVAVALAAGSPAAAAPTLVKVGDFASPTYVTSPPNDPRLFVVEQRGTIKLAGSGKTFLDQVSGTGSGGNEQGLLSMAFPPDYAASGLFYVAYTAGDRSLVVDELRRSADPDAADPAYRRQVIAVSHDEAENHNGGQVQFGPDGYLYVGTGDGGNSNDTPTADAEHTASPRGKILRLSTSGAAPADNPFGNAVWAYGLRNPWRFSFDRATGDLTIADVGQGHREEIDFAPAAAGRGRGTNFGWRCWEGKIPTPQNPSATGPEEPTLCPSPPAGTQPPVIDFRHAEDGFCSITGGYVVRDPGLPSLDGRYVYADFCAQAIRSLVLTNPSTDAATGLTVSSPTSFGEDGCGRIHIASRAGAVYRIEDGAATPCAPAADGPGGGTGQPAADTRKPRVAVRVRGIKTLLAKRRLRVALQTDERSAATISGRLRGVARFRTRRRQLEPSARRVVVLRISRTSARRLRRTLRRKRVEVAVTVRVRDAAGNQRVARRSLRLRRRR